MPVTDDQVAALRAQLAGDLAEHKRLLAQLDRAKAASGYSALIAAAFFEAADRRFVENGKIADDAEVIQFVGSVRARTEAATEEIDPRIAERLIGVALGKGSLADVDNETVIRTQLYLLAALVADAQLNASDLDAFMAEVRSVAEEWTG